MHLKLTTTAFLMSRQGRDLQRYDRGRRLVVGCIPYRLDTANHAVEVLVISTQKGDGMMFPKGGWESDETITQAASREALEEAGVEGEVEDILGKWEYKSRRYNTMYEGFMFPLRVTEELKNWPEMYMRTRKWVTVAEATQLCQHLWMTRALAELDQRLSSNNISKDTAS